MKFSLCKQDKHDNIYKFILAFEDYCSCFQFAGFFPKKWILTKMFVKMPFIWPKRKDFP